MTTIPDPEKEVSTAANNHELSDEEREQQRQQERLNALLQEHGSTWDNPNDPQDPYNWPSFRKITVAIIVSLGQFVTIMTASIMAAALTTISHDLGMEVAEMQIAFSIFMLGLAFAPFLVAAISEIQGRKPIWLACNVWYVFWNAMCPVGHSRGLMIFGRLMAGCGASAGVTLTSPVLADMYRAEDRGKSLALATFIPYLGPALGPILGGVLSQNLSWEWLFWILSIFQAAVTVLGIFIFSESYTPTILRKKAAAQRSPSLSPPQTPWSKEFQRDLFLKLRANLLRPMLLLVKRPVIQVISLVMALNFGIYLLMLSTYASLWIERYHQSETISSLNYIAIAIGSTVSSQVGGHAMDWIYRRLRTRNNGETAPEYRIPFLIPAIVMMPAGLFWYGWSAERGISWVMVDFGAAIFTCGSFVLSQGMVAYLLDEFQHAASANAAARMLSYILAFAFPTFAPQMYDRLGYGWGNSLLAFVFLAIGAPVPLLLWVWGPKLRAWGRKP